MRGRILVVVVTPNDCWTVIVVGSRWDPEQVVDHLRALVHEGSSVRAAAQTVGLPQTVA